MPDKKVSGSKGKTIFLVDGSALIYRAYFAFIRNPLINSKGENTSAAYGFVNSLMKIIKDEKPDYLAVVFDTKAPTFRHKRYDQYKATRVKMPDELVAQLPRIHQTVKALNLFEISKEGYEADDIIATIATVASKKDMAVTIVSSDKDLFQLVNDQTRIYLPQKGSLPPVRLDREGVKEKLGVYPERVIDLLALTGDSSDNIPGIPGIGPKTALSLLEQFGSFQEILDKVEEIETKSVRAKVADNKDKALLSYELVTIDRHVPLDITIDDLLRKNPDVDVCRVLFKELEFFSLLREISQETSPVENSRPDTGTKYTLVKSLSELEHLISSFSKVKEVAVGVEAEPLNSITAQMIGISLAIKAREAYYIPLGHIEHKDMNLPKEKALELLASLFKNKQTQKITYDFKNLIHLIDNESHTIAPISFDAMLASYVLNPSARGHGFDDLVIQHFGQHLALPPDVASSSKSKRSIAQVSPEAASEYVCQKADFSYRLRAILAPQIEEKGLSKLYYNIELPLVPVLARMEKIGVKIDTEFLSKLSFEMQSEIESIAGAIYAMAGYEFNINSTQQLAKILFEDLKLPTKGKTAKKTGFATDIRVLEELSELHPLPKAILQYRQLSKLKSTYVDALPGLVNQKSGRVHTTFNQAVTATGRLSSSDPNLQNIPIRTESGREIRKAFVPTDKNHSLLVADYSQIELRILAHYSGDEGLIRAFQKGEDIHTRTAAEVYGVPLGKVTPEQRRAAKTANFAIIYGVSAYGLAQQTELNLSESKDFIETYFERYPGIKTYINDTISAARKDGFVTTLMGRRRYLPEINNSNRQLRQFAERTAINTPIQGTAADLIKMAMIKLDKELRSWKSAMVLQVHDELIFDAVNGELDDLKELVRAEMSGAFKMKVPLVVDIGVGNNWLEAK